MCQDFTQSLNRISTEVDIYGIHRMFAYPWAVFPMIEQQRSKGREIEGRRGKKEEGSKEERKGKRERGREREEERTREERRNSASDYSLSK